MFQKFIRNSYLYKFIVLSSQTNNLYFVHFSIDVAPALENGWTQFCVLLWTAPVLIMMFFFFFFLVTLLFNPLQPFHWALEKYRLLWIWTLRDYVAMIAPWQNSIKSTDATQLAQRAHSIITQTKSGPIKGSSFCHSIWMEWIFCF